MCMLPYTKMMLKNSFVIRKFVATTERYLKEKGDIKYFQCGAGRLTHNNMHHYCNTLSSLRVPTFLKSTPLITPRAQEPNFMQESKYAH